MQSDVNMRGVDDEAIAVCIMADSKENHAKSMEEKLQRPPRLLQSSAGSFGCCIFRIPPTLMDINAKAYHPQIVSIGPYHHGKEHLRLIEEHKWRMLRGFLKRNSHRSDAELPFILESIRPMEERIRESYSEFIDLSSRELIEMMLLDGVFVLELLYKVDGLVPIEGDDPIFNVPWIFSFLLRDLLRLENQIPFFLLQHLFDISSQGKNRPLAVIALRFFNYAMRRSDSVMEWFEEGFRGKQAMHLLDVFRLSLIPRNPAKYDRIEKKLSGSQREVDLLPSAKKLWKMGVRFKVRKKADSFLDIRFKHGVLEAAAITIDDFTTCLLLNCIAFEQCSSSCTVRPVTDYAALMGFLITSAHDSEFLSGCKIIENYMGSNEEMTVFFNNIGKDVALDIERGTYAQLFYDVNRYSRRSLQARLGALRHLYFSNPWSLVAVYSATLLLVLTALQTWYTIRMYESPPKT